MRKVSRLKDQGAAGFAMETLEKQLEIDETPLTTDRDLGKGTHRVILYNDDYHTFDDVASQVSKATGCSYGQGWRHAEIVHTRGRDIVYHGSAPDCEKVANILRQIRLQVEVDTL